MNVRELSSRNGIILINCCELSSRNGRLHLVVLCFILIVLSWLSVNEKGDFVCSLNLVDALSWLSMDDRWDFMWYGRLVVRVSVDGCDFSSDDGHVVLFVAGFVSFVHVLLVL